MQSRNGWLYSFGLIGLLFAGALPVRADLPPDLKGQDLRAIKGLPPPLTNPPPGCSFHPRCTFARDRCKSEEPPLYEVPGGRGSACHYWEEVMES